MRGLPLAVLGCALAGCTVSVPAPPDQRAALPACANGELVVSGPGGLSCASQQSLVVAQVDTADHVDTANSAETADEATSAHHAEQALGVAATAHVLLAPAGTSPQFTGPGLEVVGGVMLEEAHVPFVVGSFDSSDGGVVSTATFTAPDAGTAEVPFTGATFTLPERPAGGGRDGGTPYALTLRASGVITATGTLTGLNSGETRCDVNVSVLRTDVTPLQVFDQHVAVVGFGRGGTPQGETPWFLTRTLDVPAGTYSVGVTLREDASSVPLSGAGIQAVSCETNGEGEHTHLELEAF